MPQRKKTNADIEQQADRPDPETTAGSAAAGAAAGAGIGALAGGPVGAAVGGTIGGVGGAATAAAATYDEGEFRREYESGPYRDRYSWEQVAPAYRYGWEGYDPKSHHESSYDQVGSHLRKGWSGEGAYADLEPMIRTGWERRAQRELDAGGEAVVPVVEEEVKVGKRTVKKGGVKVETEVRERPVEETVRLHEEKVEIERRPANRAATEQEVAFKEGSLELTETAEEAVVSKRPKVVEEVVIRKKGEDHTETVHETARRTDVNVGKTAGTGEVVSSGTTKVLKWDDLEQDFRSTYQKQHSKTGKSYEVYAPAYRYGYDIASDKKYAGKEWTSVEPEARRHWEKSEQGPWEDFKDSIQYAWDKVRGRR